MDDATQPVAGELAATILHACQEQTCPHYHSRGCPAHAWAEDLGVIAGWNNRKAVSPDDKG